MRSRNGNLKGYKIISNMLKSTSAVISPVDFLLGVLGESVAFAKLVFKFLQ